MSDDTQEGPADAPPAGAPTMAGKMMIPDMSGLDVGQSSNIAAMGAVSNQAAAAFQKIVTSQQSALVCAVETFQKSTQEASLSAGMSPDQIPDITVQAENMSGISQNFTEVASTLSLATALSAETLMKSVAQSMAKIEETAEKFSGG